MQPHSSSTMAAQFWHDLSVDYTNLEIRYGSVPLISSNKPLTACDNPAFRKGVLCTPPVYRFDTRAGVLYNMFNAECDLRQLNSAHLVCCPLYAYRIVIEQLIYEIGAAEEQYALAGWRGLPQLQYKLDEYKKVLEHYRRVFALLPAQG